MVDYFFPRVFIPYPGSDPFENPSKYGIDLEHGWEAYARYSLTQPFDSKELPKQELEKQMLGFYKELAEHMENL